MNRDMIVSLKADDGCHISPINFLSPTSLHFSEEEAGSGSGSHIVRNMATE